MRASHSILVTVSTVCPYCGGKNEAKAEVKNQDWNHFFVTCSCKMTHVCEMRLVPESRVFRLERVESGAAALGVQA